MMNRKSLRVFSTVLAAAALGVFAELAVADVSFTRAEKLRASGEVLPQDKIVELVNKTRPGEITDMELDHDFGRHVYEVEVRDAQHQEWDLEFDAKTGELLGEHQDD